jgi:phage terminase large subunit
MDLTFEWPPWKKLVNERFLPLVNMDTRHVILWGSRGSSKSDFTTKKLIFHCLNDKYFRFLLVRKVFRTIKNSQWQSLVDTINEMGLSSFFNCTASPLEITCFNGNKFIAVGCDDPAKIKSVKDPTGAWYEEDIISENEFITITTSIRAMKADRLLEIFTINPEVKDANYEDNWFYKKFFNGQEAKKKTFRSTAYIEIEEERFPLEYVVHHSTYKDNLKHLPRSFMAFLESLKKSSPYYYDIYTLGLWSNRVAGNLFYHCFDRSRHISEEYTYQPNAALHITFDFNVNPFVSCAAWQVLNRGEDYRTNKALFDRLTNLYKLQIDKIAIQIDEVCGVYPDNNTPATARIFFRRYENHYGGLFVYGDPAGKHKDTRDEKQRNDFDLILKELKTLGPRQRVAESAPPIVSRGTWINQLMAFGGGGVALLWNQKCKNTVDDYLFGKEDSDGTKFKERKKDPESGVSYETRHHLTDANDYFLTYIFKTEFNNYLRGDRPRLYTTGTDKNTMRFKRK